MDSQRDPIVCLKLANIIFPKAVSMEYTHVLCVCMCDTHTTREHQGTLLVFFGVEWLRPLCICAMYCCMLPLSKFFACFARALLNYIYTSKNTMAANRMSDTEFHCMI